MLCKRLKPGKRGKATMRFQKNLEVYRKASKCVDFLDPIREKKSNKLALKMQGTNSSGPTNKQRAAHALSFLHS